MQYNCTLQNITEKPIRAEGGKSEARRFLFEQTETKPSPLKWFILCFVQYNCTIALGKYLYIK